MQQQAARSLAAWPPCAAPRLQLRPVRALRATRRPAALRPPRAERLGGSGGSFDGEEKLDYSLTRELDSVAGRERYQKLSQHLELLYQASQSQSEVRSCVGVLSRPSGGGARAGRAGSGRCRRAPVAPALSCLLRASCTMPAPPQRPSSPPALQRNKVELCQCCRGSGERECEWCHGTGTHAVGADQGASA